MSSPSSITFFIDRCLGSKRIVTALRQAGITVEIHDDNFAPDAPDVDWLPIVGERGWVVLTKDANIDRRPLERMAVARSGVGLFILTSPNLSGNDMIEILIKAIVPMQNLVRKHSAPFIAKIYRDSSIEIWRDREALSQELNKSQR
jgi:predicted nuclease of predicted toxin-antitoxin system